MSLLSVCSALLGVAPIAGAAQTNLQIPDLGLFERNEGQFAPNARYLLKRPGLDYWITDEGITMDIHRVDFARRTRDGRADHRGDVQVGHVVKVSMVNSRVSEFRGEGATKTPFNVYKGAVKINGQTRYSEVWRDGVLPGVKARYYQDSGSPRYDFVLDSPARLASVELKYEGVNNLKIAPNGDLIYGTAVGEIRERGLTVYQTVAGKRRVLDASFRVTGGKRVGFTVKGADPALPLTIDPQVMRDGTYFSANDTSDIETLPNGDILVAGQTYSPDLPTHAGAYKRSRALYGDGFFARFRPRLHELMYCTYFGGSDDDYGFKLARNPTSSSGAVYFGCQTYSADLPVTSKAPFSAFPRGLSPYLGAISPDLGTIRYGTYFGSRNGDFFYDLTLSRSGNVYFVLGAYEGSYALPTIAEAPGSHTTFPSNSDYETFVGGLNSALNKQFLGVYIGGEGYDEPKAIAMGTDGTVWLAGNTSSNNFRFGGTELSGTTPFQNKKSASTTPFVVRMRYTGQQLYASYFGGSSDSFVKSLAISSRNEPVITGATDTPDLPFPGKVAMDFGYHEASFVAKLSSDLTSVVAGTYLTGYPVAVKLDDIDQAYVLGDTYQSEFPVVGDALRGQAYESSSDVFLTRLSSDLSTILSNATIGGDAYEEARNLTIGAAPWRNVTLVGNKFGDQGPTMKSSPSYPSYIEYLPDYSSSFISTIGYTGDPYEIRPSASSVTGGQSSFVQVRLNLPAGPAGTRVTYTSSHPAIIGFKDSSVLVPNGVDFFSTKIFTKKVLSQTIVTITATGPDGNSASTPLTVKAS